MTGIANRLLLLCSSFMLVVVESLAAMGRPWLAAFIFLNCKLKKSKSGDPPSFSLVEIESRVNDSEIFFLK